MASLITERTCVRPPNIRSIHGSHDDRPGRRPPSGVGGRWHGGATARGLLGLALFLLLLELLPRPGLVNQAYLPPFSAMRSALVDQLGTGSFWTALLETIRGWALGLSIAMVAGVSVGVVIGSVSLLRESTASTIEFLRPIPSVALSGAA